MASNDTAALVVALSAQLTRFEKDMKGAVDIAGKQSKAIETRFAAMNKEINAQFNSLAASQAGNIGAIGSILLRLGPAGVAAALGIGAAVGVLLALSNAATEFAARAKRLVESAETIGLTINQLKLLGQAGQRAGLDFDESAAFFTQYITRLAQLRDGGGPLFDALLKIDVELLRQLSVTKDSARAVDLLVAAFGRLKSASDKLELSKAAGGKGGLSGGRLLDDLGRVGGLTGLEANSPRIDEAQIERAARLGIEIEAIGKRTQGIWASMFSTTILEHQKAARLEMQELALWVERIVKGTKDIELPGADRAPTRITVFRNPDAQPAAPAAPAAGSPSVELAILQKNLALLGDAVTQGEQYRLKQLQIAAAVAEGGIKTGVANRAQEAFNLTMRASALATLERLGVAQEQQIVDVRLAQLQQDKIKFGLKENEVQQATVVILREAKQAAEALEVRRAYLPGLKQLELDARNARKQLDELSVNSLNTFADGLTDIVTGTKSVKDAFRDMANSIIKDFTRMAIKGALGQLIGAAIGTVPGNAGGTNNWQGGPTWVGERGPEILNLPRGSQVIPNDVARGMGGGSVSAPITINMDARGADGNATDRAVQQLRAELPGLAVRAVQQARSRLVPV